MISNYSKFSLSITRVARVYGFGLSSVSLRYLRTSGTLRSSLENHPILGEKKSVNGANASMKKHVFTKEELEAARIARIAALGPYISKLPTKWIPYAELMRLEKPVGTLMLLLPSLWGVSMASYSINAPLTTFLSATALFSIGALVMRGAGCTINDMLDRNLDNQVARTIERPIASGRVSMKNAVIFLGAQCFVGLLVLLSLPFECFYIGALSLPFVATYPLFKRFTYYPQVWLAICFSWGCFLGFPAVGAPLALSVAVPLTLSNVFYCVAYDTIYAHQDKEFDVKAGIKSTALIWRENTKKYLYGLTAAQAVCFLTAGFMNSMGPGFYIASFLGFYRIFARICSVDLDNVKSCWKYFTDNIATASILLSGIVVDYLLQLVGFI